jgi:hypothetical protein
MKPPKTSTVTLLYIQKFSMLSRSTVLAQTLFGINKSYLL